METCIMILCQGYRILKFEVISITEQIIKHVILYFIWEPQNTGDVKIKSEHYRIDNLT